MTDILREISSVRGVRFACICSRAGELIERTEDHDGSGRDAENIGREIRMILEVFRLAGKEIGDLDIAYEGSRLLACAAGNALLCAVCGPQTDPAMLRLVLNVQKERLRGDRKIQEQARAGIVIRELVLQGLDEVSSRLLKHVGGLEVNHV